MPECGEAHPDRSDVFCTRENKGDQPCFEYHYSSPADLIWDAPRMPAPQPIESTRTKTREMRLRTAPATITGSPVAVREMEKQYTHDEWVEHAKQVVYMFCLRHPEDFTTRDLWALLDDTPHRRAMVLVVNHAKRQGWMMENAAQRQTEPYVTKDGVSFPMNKIVPVFRSQIARS